MGGTEIEDALISTFKLKGAEKKADVLLITDGEVWDTTNIIEAAKKSGHRIFAIGVGTSPAETLLRELAESTGGACELVSPNEDIESAIVRMFKRIHLPRANDIEINWGTNENPEWVVGTNTAIFSGYTHHVFAGFKQAPTKPAYLSYQAGQHSGRIGVGANAISFAPGSNLARLGAAERIGTLTEKNQIALALQYQLVTDETNFILVNIRSDAEKATDMPELQKIAQMQAAGWGGAGTVHETVLHCMAPMQDSIQFSRKFDSLNAADISYDQFDIPKVFRSGSINKFTADLSAKIPNNLDDEAYEIPAFLRSQTQSAESLFAVERRPTPEDIAILANSELQRVDQFSEFVLKVEVASLSEELKAVLDTLQNSMDREQAWTIVMSWILFKLSDEISWTQNTRETIELLVNELDPKLFNAGFEVANGAMPSLSPSSWA